jgi:hypothetical protein
VSIAALILSTNRMETIFSNNLQGIFTNFYSFSAKFLTNLGFDENERFWPHVIISYIFTTTLLDTCLRVLKFSSATLIM